MTSEFAKMLKIERSCLDIAPRSKMIFRFLSHLQTQLYLIVLPMHCIHVHRRKCGTAESNPGWTRFSQEVREAACDNNNAAFRQVTGHDFHERTRLKRKRGCKGDPVLRSGGLESVRGRGILATNITAPQHNKRTIRSAD